MSDLGRLRRGLVQGLPSVLTPLPVAPLSLLLLAGVLLVPPGTPLSVAPPTAAAVTPRPGLPLTVCGGTRGREDGVGGVLRARKRV